MKRALLWSAIAFLGFRVVWISGKPAWSQIAPDFPNYYTAAWMVRHERPLVDIYDPEAFQRESERAGIQGSAALFNYFPPISALLMWPLATLSPLEAKRVWTLVSLAALVVIILVISRMTTLPVVWVLFIALLGGDALGNNFAFGQFYIVLTCLLVLACYWMDRRPSWAGLCIAIGAVTKIFPVLFILYFAVTHRWRAAIRATAMAAGLTLIGIAVMGWPPHGVYLNEVMPPTLRGELQDPYNIQWNTLQALFRRALVFEPKLNPEPILNAPAVYFFVRAFLSTGVVFLTLALLRRREGSEAANPALLSFGVIVAAISLVTPSQASYHQILLFPAVASIVSIAADPRVRGLVLVGFALICSSVMGAGTRWEHGWMMLAAFPRAYLVFGLWIGLLILLGIRLVPLRIFLSAVACSILAGALSLAAELPRWNNHLLDGAEPIISPNPSIMEIEPTVGDAGMQFSRLVATGFVPMHPSASQAGLVQESGGAVVGTLANGFAIQWAGASEPSLHGNTVVAIREEDSGWAVVERSEQDAGWRVLLRRNVLLHDPVLSPDSLRVAFAEWTGVHYRISEWNRITGNTVTLLEGDADYRHPTYDSSSRFLYYATNTMGQWDIFRVSLTDGTQRRLTLSDGNDLMPAVSTDGRTLYFASDRRSGYRFSGIFRMTFQ